MGAILKLRFKMKIMISNQQSDSVS